ncbi:hypothetical protein NMG60_11021257 [Bertholletia excelsa]
MASLKPGILTKLLDDMKEEGNGSDDVRKPVLLQIRSIIPVMDEGDLFPNRGFYLKVSDSSHATYVSLPHEQDEMILNNKLQLGQFIYAEKLEPEYPVPVIRGIMPVPGRRSCEGTPEDIVPMSNLVKFLESSNSDIVKDKGVISEKPVHDSGERRFQGRLRSSSAPKTRVGEQRRGLSCITKRCEDEKRNSDSSQDTDTDSDSPKSTVSSTRITKRRSWNETELLDVKKIFNSSSRETRPRTASRSANASPAHSVRYDSSEDSSTSTTRGRVAGSTIKSLRSSNRSKMVAPKIKDEESFDQEAISNVIDDKKRAESRILWDSFPSSLAKLGKDMVKQRDNALLVAVEALQEACAADKLISNIRTLLVQSLTNISPLRTSCTDINSSGSVKEVLDLAVERKKNATSWINSAIALNLCPFSASIGPKTEILGSGRAGKKSSPSSRITKPKGACIISKQRNIGEVSVGIAFDKDNPLEWARGSTLQEAAELASSLREESRRTFLDNIEKFLDDIESKTCSLVSDSHLTGMMYQIKRVNDWLDVVKREASSEKNGCKENSVMRDSEMEVCRRLRAKIYEVLLKHVERTAMALASMNAAGVD